MTDPGSVVSETSLAYDVFGPVWGLAVLGATTAVLPRRPGGGFLPDHVGARRQQLDTLLATVRVLGAFSEETMSIVEAQGGWQPGRIRTADEVAADLVLYSGFLEPFPVPMEQAHVLRRLVRAGVDLQLTNLTDGLVGAALARGPQPDTAAPLIAAALGTAASLAGAEPAEAVPAAFRAWRVGTLPKVLRPDSNASDPVRARLRDHVRALERCVLG